MLVVVVLLTQCADRGCPVNTVLAMVVLETVCLPWLYPGHCVLVVVVR